MGSKPDYEYAGVVTSLTAISYIDADNIPYFVFQILEPTYAPPDGEPSPVFYLDLTTYQAHALVAVITAAYLSKKELRVRLGTKKMRADWVAV